MAANNEKLSESEVLNDKIKKVKASRSLLISLRAVVYNLSSLAITWGGGRREKMDGSM